MTDLTTKQKAAGGLLAYLASFSVIAGGNLLAEPVIQEKLEDKKLELVEEAGAQGTGRTTDESFARATQQKPEIVTELAERKLRLEAYRDALTMGLGVGATALTWTAVRYFTD